MSFFKFSDVGSGPSSLASDMAGPTSMGSEYNKENISPESSVTVAPILTPTRLVHTLQEQVRMIRRAAEMLVKQSHNKESSHDLVSDKDRDTYESDVAELQEQIVKLKGTLFLLLGKTALNICIFSFSVTVYKTRTNCHSAHRCQSKQADS